MPDQWTGEVVALMHIHRITAKRLAKELGYTEPYVSTILNGKRSPTGAETKFKKAIEHILQEERKDTT